MREIKFRVWDEKYGLSKPFNLGGHPDFYACVRLGDPPYTKPYWALTTTIEQYTGLKDKNGKEIYEGDVVYYNASELERGTATIGWDNGCFMFVWDQKECSFYDIQTASHVFGCSEELEIIGNIHEKSDK